MSWRERKRLVKLAKKRVHKQVKMGEGYGSKGVYLPDSDVYKELPELDVLKVSDIEDIICLK